MFTIIQIRRGEAADWSSANPVLADGEMGFETDTGALKVGDGATPWANLITINDVGTENVKAVVHGSNENALRPDAAVVYWYGSVAPSNAEPRDEWIEEA